MRNREGSRWFKIHVLGTKEGKESEGGKDGRREGERDGSREEEITPNYFVGNSLSRFKIGSGHRQNILKTSVWVMMLGWMRADLMGEEGNRYVWDIFWRWKCMDLWLG